LSIAIWPLRPINRVPIPPKVGIVRTTIMNIPERPWFAAAVVAALALLPACASDHADPNYRFKTAAQSFGASDKIDSAEAEPDAIQRSTLAAPYADVYRAALVAASQAQFNVESEDRRAGVILATQDLRAEWRPGSPTSVTQMRKYYRVDVRETGPRSTEVLILSKVQAQCEPASKVTQGLVVAASFGLALIGSDPEAPKLCAAINAGMWAKGRHSNQQELGQFMTFVRNNLIASGAL